ncbi:MAG: TSUP family transporter [Bdellovibrionales bacterium]|nr:TSUP family transporter [Bdellovibrionales bacterium]
MEYLGWFLSVIMGLVMGLIGGGGSIITVPLLVYFYKIEPTKATLASLLVVGSTAIIGIFSAARQGNLRLRESLILQFQVSLESSFQGSFWSQKCQMLFFIGNT